MAKLANFHSRHQDLQIKICISNYCWLRINKNKVICCSKIQKVMLYEYDKYNIRLSFKIFFFTIILTLASLANTLPTGLAAQGNFVAGLTGNEEDTTRYIQKRQAVRLFSQLGKVR